MNADRPICRAFETLLSLWIVNPVPLANTYIVFTCIRACVFVVYVTLVVQQNVLHCYVQLLLVAGVVIQIASIHRMSDDVLYRYCENRRYRGVLYGIFADKWMYKQMDRRMLLVLLLVVPSSYHYGKRVNFELFLI